MINILLVEDAPEVGMRLKPMLESKFGAKVQEIYSLQAAIELLEAPWQAADLIICDYHGGSTALLKCLVELCKEVPALFVIDENTRMAELLKSSAVTQPIAIQRKFLFEETAARLTEFLAKRNAAPVETKSLDDEFVRIPTRSFAVLFGSPLEADIYIRNTAKAYAISFKNGEKVDLAKVDKFFVVQSAEYFYVRKDQMVAVMKKQEEHLDHLIKAEPVPAEKARVATEETIELIQDLVEKVGFTPQVQSLARRSVQLTQKLIGSKPRLSLITDAMKKNEGKYLSAHSLMLAELSCAMAAKMEWNSPGTFLKLIMASFLHDISLKDNELARCSTIEEALLKNRLEASDVAKYKLHPFRAAEYSRSFHEIPSDVDHIISQHHERPDGTGFPRQLHHQQISPMSALFIMAHDLLRFFYDRGEEASIKSFIEEKGSQYQQGVFKKILKGLSVMLLVGLFASNSYAAVSKKCLEPLKAALEKPQDISGRPVPASTTVVVECQYYEFSELAPEWQKQVRDKLKAIDQTVYSDTKLSEVLGYLKTAPTNAKGFPPGECPAAFLKLSKLGPANMRAVAESDKDNCAKKVRDFILDAGPPPAECSATYGEIEDDFRKFVDQLRGQIYDDKYFKLKSTVKMSDLYETLVKVYSTIMKAKCDIMR